MRAVRWFRAFFLWLIQDKILRARWRPNPFVKKPDDPLGLWLEDTSVAVEFSSGMRAAQQAQDETAAGEWDE